MGNVDRRVVRQICELQEELLERSKEVSGIQRKLLEGGMGRYPNLGNIVEGARRDVLMIKDQIKKIDSFVDKNM